MGLQLGSASWNVAHPGRLSGLVKPLQGICSLLRFLALGTALEEQHLSPLQTTMPLLEQRGCVCPYFHSQQAQNSTRADSVFLCVLHKEGIFSSCCHCSLWQGHLHRKGLNGWKYFSCPGLLCWLLVPCCVSRVLALSCCT